MKTEKYIKVMKLLRLASDELEKLGGDDILFPGWEGPGGQTERGDMIQLAAGKILNKGLTYDEGSTIHTSELAALIHYIGDMMEPWEDKE